MVEPELRLPPTLNAYLKAGGDLTLIPDLEDYARLVLISWNTCTTEFRRRLAGHFGNRLAELVSTGHADDPSWGDTGLSFHVLRHHMWLRQALTDPKVAEAFEAALPGILRDDCWRRIGALRGAGRSATDPTEDRP